MRESCGCGSGSGGARTVYVYLVRASRIYFLVTFAKNEQVELSSADRATVAAMIASIQREG